MYQKMEKKFDSIPCKNIKDAKDIIDAIKTVEDEVSNKSLNFVFA